MFDMIKKTRYKKLYDLRNRFKANRYILNLFQKLHLMKTKRFLKSAYKIFKIKKVFYSF
jgi:hypothetical protein